MSLTELRRRLIGACIAPGWGGLPRWVTVVDVLTVLVAFAALSVDLFGTFRVRGFLTMASSFDAWLAVAVLLVGRHALVSARPLPVRLVAAITPRLGSEAVRVFLLTRVPPLVVAYLAVSSFGFSAEPPFRLADSPLANLLARWDSGWYISVAFEGYKAEDEAGEGQHNLAFFPGYPLLIRTGTALTLSGRQNGLQSWGGLADFVRDPDAFSYPNVVRNEARRVGLIIGWLLSCGAFLWALVLLGRLARDDLPDDAAAASLVLLGAYPFAIFFSAVYTESLYLLCAVGAIHAFRHRRLAAAAGWGLAIGLIRPNGMFLAIPLGLAAAVELWPWLTGGRLRSGGRPPEAATGRARWAPLVVAATPTVGLMLYSLFLWGRFGRPLAWLEAQAGWNRELAAVLALAVDQWQYLVDHGLLGFAYGRPADTLNLAATVLALACIWPVTKRFGILYGSFLAVNLLPALVSGGLESMGRYTAVLFPIFFYLAARLGVTQRAGLAAAFGTLQGLLAALFFTWRPPF